MGEVIHCETMRLCASPEQVETFIMTPERILDFYPGGIEGGVLESGQRIYCRGKSGVSLLERIADSSNRHRVVLNVTTAIGMTPPYTAERILAARFFSMTEDWELQASGEGCILTKTWRDLIKYRLRLLPMRLIIKRSAKAESPLLQAAWNHVASRIESRV